MYNTELPTHAELPTSRQLIRSTLIAAAVAGALLITAILPAEYGIDPTGIGNALGLKRMGEIKASLAREALSEAQASIASAPGALAPVPPIPAPVPVPAVIAVAPAAAPQAGGVTASKQPLELPAAGKTDEVMLTLKPGQAAEIKLSMLKGAKVTYKWVVRGGGTVNFDTHGDSTKAPAVNYHGYGKGRQSTGDEGTLTAAFDGNHGWYWRNRSNEDAVLTLSTQGAYSAVKRVL